MKNGDRAIRVVRGWMDEENTFLENEKKPLWGTMHEKCYARSVVTPDILLKNIREIAKVRPDG